jgi:glycosyltransferase involved in cell wall biosynthesis
MTEVPRLTIGLPVYNGQTYLAEALDALLDQSYKNFELIISDNASADNTADICQRYVQQDSRVRYIRQPVNIGLAPNHNVVVEHAQGELFKWASNDDLYARELVERCVDALDEHPDVVLAHCWSARVDGSGVVTDAYEYPLNTASPRAPERFRSVLFESGGDDDYGVIRTEVLRRTAMKESYHHADHTIIAELALHGRFYQVPDWLYFRRDHSERAERACPTTRSRCVNMDPRRASRLRHPAVRLYGEYIWAYIRAIQHAPLSAEDKRECYRYLAQWFTSRARRGGIREVEIPHQALPSDLIGSVVARRPEGQALRLRKTPPAAQEKPGVGRDLNRVTSRRPDLVYSPARRLRRNYASRVGRRGVGPRQGG